MVVLEFISLSQENKNKNKDSPPKLGLSQPGAGEGIQQFKLITQFDH